MITLKVPGDMDGLSAQAFLGKYIDNLREAEQLFGEGKVRSLPLGRRLEALTPVKRGTRVVVFTERTLDSFHKVAEVVYEDEEFVVFNKPRGMSCIERAEEGAR